MENDTYSLDSFPGLYAAQSTFPWPSCHSLPSNVQNSLSVRPGGSRRTINLNLGAGARGVCLKGFLVAAALTGSTPRPLGLFGMIFGRCCWEETRVWMDSRWKTEQSYQLHVIHIIRKDRTRLSVLMLLFPRLMEESQTNWVVSDEELISYSDICLV